VSTDLEHVRIGDFRLRGYLGHGLAIAGSLLYRGIKSGRVWRIGMYWVFFSMFSIGSVRLYREYRKHELKSPVEKATYVVEESRADGEMIIRNGTTHIKLACQRHSWLQPDNKWDSNSYGCFILDPGQQEQFDKWDDRTFVRRTTGHEDVYAKPEDTRKTNMEVPVEDMYEVRDF
jgi:hypothetical protein